MLRFPVQRQNIHPGWKISYSHFLLHKCICWDFLLEIFDKLHFHIDVNHSMTFWTEFHCLKQQLLTPPCWKDTTKSQFLPAWNIISYEVFYGSITFRSIERGELGERSYKNAANKAHNSEWVFWYFTNLIFEDISN